MGSQTSSNSLSHCRCAACSNIKIFSSSSFIVLEDGYSDKPAPSRFFFCLQQCGLKSGSQETEPWKTYFIEEALKLGNGCCWVTPLIKSARKLKNHFASHFLNEINFINYLTNIFVKDSLKFESQSVTMAKTRQSLQLKHEKILKKSDIRNLLKEVGIFPEEYFSFGLEDEPGVKISREFYKRNIVKEEALLLGENSNNMKNKSTRDSLGIITKSFLNEDRKKKSSSFRKDNVEKSRTISEYRNNTILGIMQCNQELAIECTQENERELKKQRMQNLHHYKLVTDIIEKHLKNESQHPLAFLKRKFVDFFLSYKKGLMDEVAKFDDLQKKKKYIQVIYEDAVSDLQQFIRIFQETVAMFYCLNAYKSRIKPPFFFGKDNMLNFITSVIFNESGVYELLLKLQIEQEASTENVIFDNILRTQTWTMENFKIPPKFCIHEKNFLFGLFSDSNKNTGFLSNGISETPQESSFCQDSRNFVCKTENLTPLIEEIENTEFRSKSLCSANFRDNIINLSFDEIFLNLGENIKDRSRYLTPKEKKLLEEEKEPYYQAIRNLQKIEKIKSPILKLKNIIKTSVLLIDAINRHFQKHHIEQDYQIESDDILALFIYICSRAKVNHLFSQCKLTEKFLTCKISNSISGYYLITLMASLSFFAEKSINKF